MDREARRCHGTVPPHAGPRVVHHKRQRVFQDSLQSAQELGGGRAGYNAVIARLAREGAKDGLGFSIDHRKENSRCGFRRTTPLLPVANCRNAESKTGGKGRLGQSQSSSNPFHIHPFWNPRFAEVERLRHSHERNPAPAKVPFRERNRVF